VIDFQKLEMYYGENHCKSTNISYFIDSFWKIFVLKKLKDCALYGLISIFVTKK